MLFLSSTDANLMPTYEVVLSRNATNSAPQFKYGVCEIVPSGNGRRSSATDLAPWHLLENVLPKDFRTKIANTSLSNDESTWLDQWQHSFSIQVVSAPRYGKMTNAWGEVSDVAYLANDGFLGNERIDYLLEGNDKSGRPVSVTISYFISVVSQDEYKKDRTGPQFQKWYKGYCPKHTWAISSSHSASVDRSGNAINAPVSAWGFVDESIAQAFSGFTDLPNTSLGQATGTGPSAKITLDNNAAGHGWYID